MHTLLLDQPDSRGDERLVRVRRRGPVGLSTVLTLAAIAAAIAVSIFWPPNLLAGPPPGCWNIVPSPNSGSSALYRVAAVSANDVWATGYSGVGAGATTLIEHWDGGQWSIVGSPNVGASGSLLQGVAAVSADDVWTVGYSDNTAVSPRTLVEHWDGAQWSVVPSPNDSLGVRGSFLRGVSAVATDDAWAVGYSFISVVGSLTLIEHWDGSSWSIVPGGSPGGSPASGLLHDVAARAEDDVWAVGWTRTNQSLALRWNGSVWSTVITPNPGTDGTFLLGIAPLAVDDAWAVGWHYTAGAAAFRTLIMRWNGSQWSIVPSLDADNHALYGVTAIAADDIWAVGDAMGRALIMHWDGTEWSVVPASDPPSTSQSFLWGIDAVSSGDVWAVNYSFSGSTSQTLTQRYTDPCGGLAIIADLPSAGRLGLTRVSPMPARDLVHIDYALSGAGAVRLRIFDVSGRLVRVLVDGLGEAGQRSAVWDGRDREGRRVANGVYRAQLTSGGLSDSRAVVLAR